MTQRERQASGGVVEAAARPASGPAVAARSTLPLEANPNRAPAWEELFRTATSAQQQELLTLAGKQGVLYSHRLPALTGSSASAHSYRHLLTSLLSGHTQSLEPLRPEPVSTSDPALDERQQDAVARAVQTPDLCLI